MAQMLKLAGQMNRLKSESSTYKLETILGEGLSSCVYRAERRDSRGHSKQRVVLKILKNKNQVEWFRQEFEALSKIDSAFCVRMLAWENLNMGPALVLEYIDGITLFDLLLQSQIEIDLILEVTAQIQLGLHCLERAGRIHGDLNLKNIMIDRAGCVKLIDFSTSISMWSDSKEIVGTPQYLAPEVWSGRERTIKSDLFALGLILIDINMGVSNIPITQVECRARAISVQNSDDLFLKMKPADREFKRIQRNWFAKKKLGKLVTSILIRRASQSQQTLRLKIIRPKRRGFQWAMLGALACSCFVTPVVSTPLYRLNPSYSNMREGRLEIRTRRWVYVSIDGKNYGYTPVILSRLRSGVHKLKWASQGKSGEITFKFEAGELRIFTEADF